MPFEDVSFHAFVKHTDGSPSVEQLRDFIEVKRSIRNSQGLNFVFGVVLLAAAILILNLYDLGGWEPALFFPAFFYFALSLLAGTQAVEAEEERKKAVRALELLQAEQRGERSKHVPEGEPFVLFLRSFDAERLGETGDECTLPYNYMGRVAGIPQPSRYPGDGVYTPFNRDWVDQMEALKIVRAKLPVFMLDNLTLPEKKQRELEVACIGVVSVIAADWWEVFLDLAKRAALIVFYVEVQSGMLSREMKYVAESDTPYLLLGSSAACAALEKDLPIFLEKAVQVLPTSGWVFESDAWKGPAIEGGRDLKTVLADILDRIVTQHAARLS